MSDHRQRAMQIMGWDPLTYDGLRKAVEEGQHPDDRESLEIVDAIAAALGRAAADARADLATKVEAVAARFDGQPWWTGHEIAVALHAVLAAAAPTQDGRP